MNTINENELNENKHTSKYLVQNNDKKKLTLREKEIIHEFEKGKTYEETAHTLDISIETVRKHATNIYKKLGVKNKLTAVLKYKQSTTFVLFSKID
jgi:DNA-binding CsgD family transcriptional regulator